MSKPTISLRFRLNLIITFVCFVALLLGSIITVINARQSVFEEVSSSLMLAQKLLGEKPNHHQLPTLNKVRHLNITLAGDQQDENSRLDASLQGEVPQLFISFVRPSLEQLSLGLEAGKNNPSIRLIADPSDEIKEAWQESLIFISLLLLLTLLISSCVFIVIGRALKPVDDILQAFVEIEDGDYSKRLPTFNLPEFNNIADGINHLSENLSASKVKNQQLSKQSLDIRENERRYLARELHDEMGQSLSAIKALSVSAKTNEGARSQSLTEIENICDHLFHVVRNRMQQLTPPLLSDFGLSTAIEELVDQWPGSSHITLTLDSSLDALVQNNAIHYYRIIQESLTNILNHAQANNVWITLNKISNDGAISLLIKDNGIGFNPSEAASGRGLINIKERVESLGGTLEIDSLQGTGCQLSAIFPINQHE
ncbi:MAG: histidine kinase [Cycloclasticus sp.]|jgi:Signal transduction histidine kinase